MKKIVLTAATAFMGMAMFAQTKAYSDWQLDGGGYFEDTTYQIWDARTRNTAEGLKRMVLDFTTDSLVGTGVMTTQGDANTGGASYETPNGLSWYIAQPFGMSFNTSEQAMQIDADIYTGADNWSEISMLWPDLVQQDGGTVYEEFNPFITGKDTVVGPLIDLSTKTARMVEVTYKVSSASECDSIIMRCDLGDANGRVSNAVTPHHFLYKATDYQTVRFLWTLDATEDASEYDVHTMMDQYTQSFFGLGNGRSTDNPLSTLISDSYTASVSSMVNTTNWFELEESKIAKIVFGFNDGVWSTKTAGMSNAFTVYIKKVDIGDQEAAVYYDLAKDKLVDPSVGSSVVEAGKGVVPTIGNNFKFEGNGVMVDVLGKQVAQGVNEIDAKNIKAGVYFIVVDGVATQVIVK